MKGAEVKGGADIRFAMQNDDSGKTAATENGASDDITPLEFVGGIVVAAGLAGFVALFFADIPAGWGFVLFPGSLLLALIGGVLHRHAGRFNEMVRYVRRCHNDVRRCHNDAQREIRQVKQDSQAARRESEERVANAEHEFKTQLEEFKATKEKLKTAMHDMRKEMETREGAAAAKYKKLQWEKIMVDNELLCAQNTLEYYSENRGWLDVYSGADALRECGGIYVVKNIGDGKVKIGMTDNFVRRFAEIQSSCATAGIKKEDVLPEILVPLDEGKAEAEKEIHNALGDYKTAGEWFKVSPEGAVTLVLHLVHRKRRSNFEGRNRKSVSFDMIPPKGGKISPVCFGVNWESATPDDVEKIPLFIADARGTLHRVINNSWKTPLTMAASFSKNGEVITTLLEKTRATLREMKTPEAADAEMLQSIQILLEDVVWRYDPNPGVMQALISAGGDINKCRSLPGWTPLASAIHKGNAEFVARLIQAGADVNDVARNYSADKSTPLDIAEKQHGADSDITKMLVAAGAVRSADLPEE